MAAKRIVMITTNTDKMENGRPTGLWWEEFAAPYRILRERGYDVVVASPRGGNVPIDPASLENVSLDGQDGERQALSATQVLSEQDRASFDAIFFPGGHGPLYDLPEDPTVKAFVAGHVAEGKPVAAVCHGVAALLEANVEGKAVVAGRRVTGFSDTEEAAVQLTDAVPYSVEQRLVQRGATYEKAGDWADHIVVDGPILTGQNPASSEALANALVKALG